MTEWTFDEQRQVGELVVSGALTVTQVRELKGLLIDAIGQAPLVQVDLGRVEQVDIAGLQLFCAAHRLADANGKRLSICTASEAVLQLVNTAGFAHPLVCDQGRRSACIWAQKTQFNALS